MIDVAGGAVLGGAVGLVLQRAPVSGTTQSAISGALAYLSSTFVLSLVWAARIVESGIVAISFGVADAVVGLLVACIAAAGLHLALGAVGSTHVRASRPLIIGLLAGAMGAFAVSHGMQGLEVKLEQPSNNRVHLTRVSHSSEGRGTRPIGGGGP